MTDEARAIAEVANATGKGLDLVKAASGFLSGVLGSLPEDLIGLAGADWAHEKRRQNIAKLQNKTATILAELDQARLSDPSVSVVLPLLQTAADESRPELQALWAALLANAMLDGGRRVRRDYFEAIKAMEPADVLLLDIVARQPEVVLPEETLAFFDSELDRVGLSSNDRWISVEKLRKLNCLGVHWPGTLTPFGIGLVEACTVT